MTLSLAQFLENAGSVNHARDFRRMQDKMHGWDVRVPNAGLATTGLANGGVARYYGSGTTGDFAVTQRGAGANMSVDISAGGALVGGTESATQGNYFAYNDATVNVTISASDPTNPRIDVIGIRIRDTEYSGANNDAAIIVVTGTPAGVPAVPSLPANFLTLAHVAVAALAASITNINITDKRRNITSLGGIILCTSATRPTVNLWAGMVIIETDTVTAGGPVAQVYDGTNWVGLSQFGRAWAILVDTLLGADGAISGGMTSIPQTFTHLQLIGSLRSGRAITSDPTYLRFNSDGGANYDYGNLYANNATPAAGATVAGTFAQIAQTSGTTAAANVFASFNCWIPNYRSTSMHKNGHSISGTLDVAAADFWYVLSILKWRSTTAISAIQLLNGSSADSYKAGSRLALIGIR